MLDEAILAAICVAVVVLVFLAVWKLWHCLAWHTEQKTCQPNDANQPLIVQIEPNEVTEQEVLGLETGQTLKRRAVPSLQREDSNRRIRVAQVFDSGVVVEEDHKQTKLSRGSTISLEVVSGPSAGASAVCYPGQSLAIGRLPTNNLVVNDAEVSGRHACIKWNSQSSAWDFVDLGSLNGTHVNDQLVSLDHSNGGSARKPSLAIELASGDIVLLGSSSRLLVHIHENVNGSRSDPTLSACPIEVGVAADPMALRRGGKRLPMEDVYFYEWPLGGLLEFGVFCIFDGHGGAAAASAASQILRQNLHDMLKVDSRREEVIRSADAKDVLLDAFNATEAALEYDYEGCTATVLLVWLDASRVIHAQCANVGDSACIFSVDGKYISMTEDHRLTSLTEQTRMLEMGKQLREGETRLCGMNIARVLGDKFLKEQEVRFSSTPFVSDVLQITQECKALAVMASDGLWDVLSQRRAVQLALEVKEGQGNTDGVISKPVSVKSIAEMLINKARTLRTKDNTTVIVLDFVDKSTRT
ncbi:hypothetical protein GOP47_0024986 [Adiantum capillus-veneris]|uniref:protein-serine/threonine phosphatase n=1 Tax=Adiantum capillus-veneris TaxID=13818 RepID=A0A9D4Z5J7_ADICA|nr:hypothetical protein GOP47_0024986 [Adiantum capillus-veneris]